MDILHMRDPTGELRPQTCIMVVLWYNIMFAYFKHKQKDMLQLYRTQTDSTTTQDHSFCVRSSKGVTFSKLWSHKYISTLLFGAQLHRHDNKTRVAYDCATHRTMALMPWIYHFIRTKWASLCHDLWADAVQKIHLHIVVCSQLQWML